jgi:hypothetical protein
VRVGGAESRVCDLFGAALESRLLDVEGGVRGRELPDRDLGEVQHDFMVERTGME